MRRIRELEAHLNYAIYHAGWKIIDKKQEQRWSNTEPCETPLRTATHVGKLPWTPTLYISVSCRLCMYCW